MFVHDTINTHGIFVDEGAQFYTMAQSNIVGGKKGDYQYSSNRNNLWNLIYDCLTAAADARNAAKAAHNRADAAYSRAGDALSDAEDAWDKAVSAYNLANSKANASHTHTTVGG